MPFFATISLKSFVPLTSPRSPNSPASQSESSCSMPSLPFHFGSSRSAQNLGRSARPEVERQTRYRAGGLGLARGAVRRSWRGQGHETFQGDRRKKRHGGGQGAYAADAARGVG